jgi:hypothetical protein
MPDLERLADLVRAKNDADAAIARLIGRPSAPGNIGEFVAARVFAIQLMASGAHPGYDGLFTDEPLAGKTVNIKTYSRHESVLDISPHPCDYYLVLAARRGRGREAREETGADIRLPAWQTCPAAPVTRSATPAATAPPTSPWPAKPGSSAVPRHPAMASSPGSPGTAARPEAEPVLPRHPPRHRPPLLHSAPPRPAPRRPPRQAPPNARNAA